MKKSLLCFAFLAFLTAASASAPETLPNVVFIYGDDVGYGDVGVYGSEKIPTPNIDALAARGIQFLDGHATASTCTPSRYSMLTGMYGFREGVDILSPDAPLVLPTDKLTLPKLFKKAGYSTAVIGKWHLGLGEAGVTVDWNEAVKPGPLEVGFDYSYLLPVTNDRVPCVYLEGHYVVNLDPTDPLYVTSEPVPPAGFSGTVYPIGREDPAAQTYGLADNQHASSVINGIGRIGYQWGGKSALWDDFTMTDHFVQKAKSFIASHREKPFFLYFPSQDIHVPRAPHPRFAGTTDLGRRGDAMVQFDWATGEIVKELEKHGLMENTIIIFSSDNGPVYDDGYADGTTVRKSSAEVDNGHDGSGQFSGGKYQIYEGGTRVPFIVSWPARITGGQVSEALVSQVDFIASFAALLEIPLAYEEAPDSQDSLAALLGEDPVGLSVSPQEAPGALAIRKGSWKYIKFGRSSWAHNKRNTSELYDLSNDVGEKNNLIDEYPEMAEELRKLLDSIVESGRMRE